MRPMLQEPCSGTFQPEESVRGCRSVINDIDTSHMLVRVYVFTHRHYTNICPVMVIHTCTYKYTNSLTWCVYIHTFEGTHTNMHTRHLSSAHV